MFREKYEECSEKMIVERKKREEGRRENLRSSKDELMKLGSFLCGYFKVKALVIKKTKGNVNT